LNVESLILCFVFSSNVKDRKFTIRLKKDPETGWYAARCVELPEVISQGRTEEEALANIKEALELVLEEYEKEAREEGHKLVELVV